MRRRGFNYRQALKLLRPEMVVAYDCGTHTAEKEPGLFDWVGGAGSLEPRGRKPLVHRAKKMELSLDPPLLNTPAFLRTGDQRLTASRPQKTDPPMPRPSWGCCMT